MDILQIISLIISFLSIISIIYFAGFRLGRIELKVDTMWQFQMRRAESEMVKHEWGKRNSPLNATEEVKGWLDSMKSELRIFYQKFGRHMTDMELTLEIERKFGERLLHEVCIPHGMYMGACLLIAAEVSKEIENENE